MKIFNNSFLDKYSTMGRCCRLVSMMLILSLGSCSEEDHFRNVGDIPFDELVDDKSFKICDPKNIKQYYIRRSSDTPAGYHGEKRHLEQTILNKYRYPESKAANGYVTIRFIVNCERQPGRFRLETMDFEYQPSSFDEELTDQLLQITRSLDGWIPPRNKEIDFDYYQYLTFKIVDGQIAMILP